MAEVIALSGVSVERLAEIANATGDKIQVNECLVDLLRGALAEAEVGKIMAAVMVVEYAGAGGTSHRASLCGSADLPGIDSMLGFAQRRVQREIEERMQTFVRSDEPA